MRIIPKLASGGLTTSYFSRYKNSTGGSSSTSITKKESTKVVEDETEKFKNLLIKEIASSFKDLNLHNNEMALLVARAKNLLSSVDVMSASEIASGYLDILKYANTYKNNKTEDDEALKWANENGTANEYAIYQDKLVVLTADGELDYISPDDINYVEDVRPLTVSQLADLRDNKMGLVNDDIIKHILRDSMSYNLFNKYLKEGIMLLGSDKISETKLYLMGINGPEELKNMKQVLSELYKMDPQQRALVIANGFIEGTIVNESQTRAISLLKDYLISILPENAKTWAALKTNKSRRVAAEELVNQYLTSMGKNTAEVKFDYNQMLSRLQTLANKDKESEKEKEDKRKTTPADMFLRGLGEHNNIVVRMSGGNAYNVSSTTMPLTDKSGSPLGQGLTLLDVSRGQYSGILDFSNMTMAGVRLSANIMNLIILSDGKVSSIDFPATKEGNYITPNITLKIVRAKAVADKELRDLGIDVTSPESIAANYEIVNLVYESKGLNPLYNEQGLPTNWTRFAVVNTFVDERVFGELDFDKSLLRKITDDYEADSIVANIQGNIKDYSTTRKDLVGSDDLYEGLVWIPISYNYQAALSGEDITITLSNDIEVTANKLRLERMFNLGSRQ